MKRSRDFRIKYINILLSSYIVLGGSKSFLLLFVYEHAHLTADYRGRDLAALRHRKANSHGYLLLPVCSGKIDKRLE